MCTYINNEDYIIMAMYGMQEGHSPVFLQTITLHPP